MQESTATSPTWAAEPYGPNARERLPQATFEILPGVEHDSMMDNPELVARTILIVTNAETRSR